MPASTTTVPEPAATDAIAGAVDLHIATQEDAIYAYKLAILRIHHVSDIDRCGEHLAQHQRALTDLQIVWKRAGWVGGERPARVHRHSAFVGGLTHDLAVLRAMRDLENERAREIRETMRQAGLPEDLRHALQRMLFASRRRRRSLRDRIAELASTMVQTRKAATA